MSDDQKPPPPLNTVEAAMHREGVFHLLKGDAQPTHPLDQLMAGFMSGIDKATAGQTPMLIETWLHAAVHAKDLSMPTVAARLLQRATDLLDRLEAAEAKGEGENT